MSLQWIKCQGNVWCKLNNVNLDHQHFNNLEGVYIIWHGGEQPATVRVGQGVIRDRLAAHRQDQEVQQYNNFTLYVTWASVSFDQLNGVERYIAERTKPKVGTRFPAVDAIEVNLPW